jgi:hypothetical protein
MPPSEPLIELLPEPVETDTARREASEAYDGLKNAIARHGIWLPDMNVDLVSSSHYAGRDLIQLGRISNGTAKALADALDRAEVA